MLSAQVNTKYGTPTLLGIVTIFYRQQCHQVSEASPSGQEVSELAQKYLKSFPLHSNGLIWEEGISERVGYT